jgi:hypothetical protein
MQISLIVYNRVLVKSMYTSVALGRNLTNYVALLWVKFGQPCSKRLSTNLGGMVSYKVKKVIKIHNCGC